VAVSGGTDSLCLLHWLNSLKNEFAFTLTVAHLNHQLRGANSQADEDFVRDVAVQWQLPIFVERYEVAALATQTKQSLEATARQVRYAFLRRVAVTVGANKIVVGHHADDQAETVLMHFLRGTGLNGLRGMLPITRLEFELRPEVSFSNEENGNLSLIRPLLETSRSEIEAYCQVHQLKPRQDESNHDTTFFRNRLRHELLPELETYNPNIRQVLRQTAKIVTADVDFLNYQLKEVWPLLVKETSADARLVTKIDLDLSAWLTLSLAMKRATLRRAIQVLAHSLNDVSFEHVESAINIIKKNHVGSKVHLPKGVTVMVGYDTFSLTIAPISSSVLRHQVPYLASSQVLPLALPGVTLLPNTAWRLTIELLFHDEVTPEHLKQLSRWEVYLDAEIVGDAPILRPRQLGDKFIPLGLRGHHQKIKDFMINTKIPADWRDHIPLLVSNNQVWWICGYRLSEEAALRPTTRQVLHLKFESKN